MLHITTDKIKESEDYLTSLDLELCTDYPDDDTLILSRKTTKAKQYIYEPSSGIKPGRLVKIYLNHLSIIPSAPLWSAVLNVLFATVCKAKKDTVLVSVGRRLLVKNVNLLYGPDLANPYFNLMVYLKPGFGSSVFSLTLLKCSSDNNGGVYLTDGHEFRSYRTRL